MRFRVCVIVRCYKLWINSVMFLYTFASASSLERFLLLLIVLTVPKTPNMTYCAINYRLFWILLGRGLECDVDGRFGRKSLLGGRLSSLLLNVWWITCDHKDDLIIKSLWKFTFHWTLESFTVLDNVFLDRDTLNEKIFASWHILRSKTRNSKRFIIEKIVVTPRYPDTAYHVKSVIFVWFDFYFPIDPENCLSFDASR